MVDGDADHLHAPSPPIRPADPSSNGISRRQGAHQVAQKLMTSDLPLQEAIGVDLPCEIGQREGGSRSGIFVGCGVDSTTRSLCTRRSWPRHGRRPPRQVAPSPGSNGCRTRPDADDDDQNRAGDANEPVVHAAGSGSVRPLRSNNPASRNARAPPPMAMPSQWMGAQVEGGGRRRRPGKRTLVIGG